MGMIEWVWIGKIGVALARQGLVWEGENIREDYHSEGDRRKTSGGIIIIGWWD